MAATATQLQITIITPQWIDLPENEKENNTSSSSLIQNQQQQNDTTEIQNATSTEENKTRKFEPIHEWQKQKFDEWLEKNSYNMYPSRDEKEKLAEMLSASYVQITRLFANQRRRIHKKTKISKDDDTSAPSTIIPEITIDPPKPDTPEIIKEMIEDENSIEQIMNESDATNCSEQSSFSVSSTVEDNNIAAICSAVADLIHVEQENKKISENPISPVSIKKKSRKRKSKVISCDDEKLLESTVDEILNKIGREDSEATKNSRKKESQPQKMEVDEKLQKDEEMPPVEISGGGGVATASTVSPNSEAVNNSLLSMVNEVVKQPPNALQLAAMGDVNPRLVEAMHLLNNGVSWTHPTILSVVIQIHQYQQQQREIQLAQQRAYLARAMNSSPMETSPPPGSESSYSHSSSKSTEELMSSLSPDECLAVNVLTDLAMAGNW